MTVREKRESIACEDGRTMCVTYLLSKSFSAEFSCDTYDISVTAENTGETATVHGVTSDRETAENMFSKIVRGRVTAVTLRYVIEDMLP